MQENLYQNIDITQENPLKTDFTETSTPDKKTLKLPKNPKIIVLIILFILIIILSLIALITTSFRQSSNPSITTATPTLLPSITLTPTPVNTLIPTIYQEKFKSIENQFNQDIDLAPPQIDTEIGL